MGPDGTLYEGGFFKARLVFPPDFPNMPRELGLHKGANKQKEVLNYSWVEFSLSYLSVMFSDDDFCFRDVAPQCLRRWSSLYFDSSSAWWRWIQFARVSGWAMETNPWCGTNFGVCDFHAIWSKRRKSCQFGCSCDVEEWQSRLQKKSATSCSEKSRRVLMRDIVFNHYRSLRSLMIVHGVTFIVIQIESRRDCLLLDS